MNLVKKLGQILDLPKSNVANDLLNSLPTAEEKKAIRQLQSFSAKELADLGLTRGEIRHAVLNGRPGIDSPDTPKAA